MLRSGLKYLGAAVLSVVVNAAAIWLLVLLNERVAPKVAARPAAPVQQLQVVKPPEKPPPPRDPLLPPRRLRLTAALAPPQLTSQVRVRSIALPDVSALALVGPVFGRGGSGKLAGRVGGQLVLDEDKVDQRPRVLKRVRAVYPQAAADDEVEGWVRLKLLVDRQGRVRKVLLLGSSPPRVFDRAAMRAVRRWVFSPARYKGKTVRVWARQKLIFKLGL